MRVETLILNFSVKDGLKIGSKTKMRNCWSMRDQGLHLCISYTVNLEPLKILYKKTIYIYMVFINKGFFEVAIESWPDIYILKYHV